MSMSSSCLYLEDEVLAVDLEITIRPSIDI
jgi:hypothetical protein